MKNSSREKNNVPAKPPAHPQLVKVKVKDIGLVWPDAQNNLRESRVLWLIDNYDEALWEAPEVTPVIEPFGLRHPLDGLHRATFAAMMWGDEAEIWCVEVPVTTKKEAAREFLRRNKRTGKKSTTQQFRVRVTEGDKNAGTVARIAAGIGYKVGEGDARDTIRSASSLERVLEAYGEEVLKDVLITVKYAWGEQRRGVTGPLFEGMGLLLHSHPHVDYDRLRTRCHDVPLSELTKKAKRWKEMVGGKTFLGYYRALAEVYNHRLPQAAKLETKRTMLEATEEAA